MDVLGYYTLHGCGRCKQVGHWKNHTIFQKEPGAMIDDAFFHSLRFTQQHLGLSPFVNFPLNKPPNFRSRPDAYDLLRIRSTVNLYMTERSPTSYHSTFRAYRPMVHQTLNLAKDKPTTWYLARASHRGLYRQSCFSPEFNAPSLGSKRSSNSNDGQIEEKRPKMDMNATDTQSGSDKSLYRRKQFPLVEEEADQELTGMLLRVYDADFMQDLKLNGLYFAVGILEHARLGAEATSDDDQCPSSVKGRDPLSRIHVIHLAGLNPQLELGLLTGNDEDLFILPFLDQPSWDGAHVANVRAKLVEFLTHLCAGDVVAAEYLLVHFACSRFQADSQYTTSLTALNLYPTTTDGATNCQKAAVDLLQRLRQTLPSLLTRLVNVESSLGALNKGPCLGPIRDPNNTSMQSGRLQLPSGSQVLVDETKMESGQLDARGLINLRALTMLANHQKVPYDFNFYTHEWETDARTLIISEHRSLVKPQLHLPVANPSQPIGDFNLDESLLCDFRQYLALIQLPASHYSIDDVTQERIQSDFVKWRSDKSTFIEADEFAVVLCLLRAYTLSSGQSIASTEHWEAVCQLEQERRRRIKLCSTHSVN